MPTHQAFEEGMASTDRMVLVLALAAFSSMASMRVCDALLPLFGQNFGISAGAASKAISVYAVAYGVFQFFFGPLADKFGKLRVIQCAVFFSVVANLGVVSSTSMDGIIFWRGCSGAAAAGIIPLSMAWIGDVVAYTHRQPTLARLLFGTLGGLIGGQLIGGICADLFQWRIGFGLLACIYLVAGILLKRELIQQRGGHASAHALDAHRLRPGLIGILREPWVRVVLMTVACEGAAVYGAFAFLPSYLHTRLNISLTGAAGVVSVFGLGGLAYATTARRLLALMGEKGLSTGGGVLLGLAFFLLIVADGWPLAAIATFMAGLGLYMLHNTLQTNATQMAPQARGTAVSMFACALFLGQSFGVAVSGFVVDSMGIFSVLVTSAISLPLIGMVFARSLGCLKDKNQ